MQQRVLEWRPDLRWISNRSDLDAIAEFIPNDNDYHPSRDRKARDRGKHYFSAAAVAIRFLNRLDTTTLNHLRHIVIQED